MQSERFRNYKYDIPGAVFYGVGFGGSAVILLSVVGAVSTKKENFKKILNLKNLHYFSKTLSWKNNFHPFLLFFFC